MIAVENRFALSFLLVLALVSSMGLYWLHRQDQHKAPNYGHYPDRIGFNLQLKRYDLVGSLSEVLTAQKSMHFSDVKLTEFDTVNMQVLDKNGLAPPWYINAPKAVAYDKSEQVDILGKTHMQQAAYAHHLASQLDTADVSIFTNQKIMTTKAEVQATQPGLKVTAIGAHYDYGKSILNLLSQVQMDYTPSEHKVELSDEYTGTE